MKEAQEFAKKYSTIDDAITAVWFVLINCNMEDTGHWKNIESELVLIRAEKCDLLNWLDDECKNVQGLMNPINQRQALKLLEQFNKEAVMEIFNSMENSKTLRKKYTSANLTFRNWLSMRRTSNPNFGVKPEVKQTKEKKAQDDDLINNM